MMKFCALNESSLSDDDGDPELATREAQEEEAYSLYHVALKKQSEGKVEESEKLLKEILEMEFLEQVKPNEDRDEAQLPDAPLRPALTLKYLLFKNLANISKLRKDFHSAVNYFLDALEIDPSDVVMWYHLGRAALNITNYSLARLSFEEGLKCNPNHWPCLDNVITVMHTLNDYANCLYYIAKALERESTYIKGLAFKDEIYREDPSLKSFCAGYFKKCDASISDRDYDKEEAQKFIQESLDMRIKKQSLYKPTPSPILALSQPIKENTWKSLGESLINMYDCIANAEPRVSFSCKVDLSPFLNATINGGEEKLKSASLSSLSCSSNSAIQVDSSAPNSQKPVGLLQLATIPQNMQNDAGQVDMEVDEAAPICNSTASPYSLVLPQVETPITDLSVCNDSMSSNRRTSKRKRLISELDFSAKRRSSRVRNPAIKKPQDNINYQELLQKFLPAKLIGDGAKSDENDCDSEPVSLDKISTELSCGQSSENEKSDKSTNSNDISSTEKDDVCQYIINNQSNSGIIDLLYNYMTILGKKSCSIWPKNLVDVFCSAFIRLRKHITTPNLFSKSIDPVHIKEVGLAILTFCEFKVDKWYLSTGHSMSFSPKASTTPSTFQNGTNGVGNDFHADMEFLVMSTARKDVFDKEWLDFSARALWLKAKFHSLEGEIDLAVQCMAKLSYILNEESEAKIIVQNSSFSNTITTEKVHQQLESLQRCQSLEEVQRLYEHGDYSAVVDLLVLSFNQPRTKRKQPLEGVPERHAQLLLLQNSLLKLERYKDCVFWSEVSFNEALQQFMNAARSDWSETMAHLLSGLDNCAKLNPKYLSELEDSKLVRLTQNLILVIVIQMENYDFSCDNAHSLVVLPWIILYRLILNEEKRKAKKSSKTPAIESGSAGNSSNKVGGSSFLSDFDLSSSMPSSLMLLFTAHEYLGRRSWCTAADGSLLLFFINVMMSELLDNALNSYLYREDLETGLEQCIYCLYGHPNKRTRAKHLQEHSAKQIPLTWEKAILIFQYFKPNVLPEFDSYRTSTVSAELESLLKRITGIVPAEEDPTTRVDNYTAYIEGVTEKCPDPPFQGKTPSIIVKDLYYLLGDYYFKNKEFSKAIRFYLMDICVNPDRQDSWAGMALSRSSQLDQKLNSYELRNESTIYRKSSAALKCFEHALELDNTTTSLWIEYGSLAYILHSHASRQLKQDSVGEDLFELLKKKKLEMLQVAEKCFRAANQCDDGGEPEEAWLHHYMLGKICEKKGESPTVYLDHFQKALMYLHEDYARYPQKILYHNPSELSIEALEVYYRVHASCLKFLWKHEDKGVNLSVLKVIKNCLKAVAASPFSNFNEKCKKETSGSSSAHSEVEEAPVTTPVRQMPKDHNYFDVKESQQTPSEVRKARPSIDSSPETLDNATVKEVMDSLVAVVAERFLDEAREKASTTVADDLKKDALSKVVVESIVEEYVYTSKLPTDNVNKELSVAQGEFLTPEVKEMNKVHVDSGAETQKATCFESNPEETDELDLAMELETEAAASFLVEEMMLDTERDTDYCDYDMFEQKQDPDPNFYECMDYVEENECNPPLPEKDEEVLEVISCLLDKVEEISAESEVVQQNEVSQSSETKGIDINSMEASDSKESGNLVIDEMCSNSASKEDNVVSSTSRDDIDKSSEPICDSAVPVDSTERGGNSIEKTNKPDMIICDSTELTNKTEPQNVLPLKDEDKQKEEVVEEFANHIVISENQENASEKHHEVDISCKQKETNELKSDVMEIDVATSAQVAEEQPMILENENNKDSKEKHNVKPMETDKVDDKQLPQPVKEIAPPTPEELEISKAKISDLIEHCINAMRECLQRFIQHYKALYRMAHYYCHSSKNKNLQWAREVLLAATPPNIKYPSMPGLFADRKNTNFFNGIWRAPSNEIDRPGSFGAHMYRSVHLLIEVLTQQLDYNMLVTLTQQLYRTPDLGKKYMRDTDRVFLVREAYDSCVNILRDQMNSLLQEEPPPEESRLICCLLEIYRSCQTLVKSGIYVDETNDLLEEAYTMYRIGEVDSHPSVLEQATKFCQLQLGKSYPLESRSSAKYNLDGSENNALSSVSSYGPDAWQREFAKSIMMPVIPCETRIKPEIKTIQDPLILIPVDGQFSGHIPQATSSKPCSVATQRVVVEKPKAENLQACSVAFLPVTPLFPKEAVNIQKPSTSLLSCKAFECFDVLTTIMQASGYKVAPQTGAVQSPVDAPINLTNPKSDAQKFPCSPSLNIPKPGVGRPRKRRRRAASQKMEALNLCKRTYSTKPIVSSVIAHSIAEIKVGNLGSSKATSSVKSRVSTITKVVTKPENNVIEETVTSKGPGKDPCVVISAETELKTTLIKSNELNLKAINHLENPTDDKKDRTPSSISEPGIDVKEILEELLQKVGCMTEVKGPQTFSVIKMAPSSIETNIAFYQNLTNKIANSVESIDCGTEDNSDTLDADIKDVEKTYSENETKDESESLLQMKLFEKQNEYMDVENYKVTLCENIAFVEKEFSKDSNTECDDKEPQSILKK